MNEWMFERGDKDYIKTFSASTFRQTDQIPTTRHLVALMCICDESRHLFSLGDQISGWDIGKSGSWRISSFAERNSIPESLQLRCVLAVPLLSNGASEYFKKLHAIRIRKLFHIARVPRGLNPFAVQVVVTKTNHSSAFYDRRRRGWSASAIHSTWLRAVLLDFPASCMSAVFSNLVMRLDSRQGCARFGFATIERGTRCGRRKDATIFKHASSRMTFAAQMWWSKQEMRPVDCRYLRLLRYGSTRAFAKIFRD